MFHLPSLIWCPWVRFEPSFALTPGLTALFAVRSKLSRRGGFGGTILLYASPRGDSAFPTTGSQDIKVEDVFRDPNVMPR